jgi:nucleoid-associated protein YgaU
VVLAATDREIAEREMAELGRRHPSTGSPLAVALETEPAVVAPTSETMTYVVQSGDSLWRIAEGEYGSGTQWKLIFEANRDVLADPRRIFPEQELRIPSAP